MVKIMENPIKMDDLGGYTYFWKHPYGPYGKTTTCTMYLFFFFTAKLCGLSYVGFVPWIWREQISCSYCKFYDFCSMTSQVVEATFQEPFRQPHFDGRSAAHTPTVFLLIYILYTYLLLGAKKGQIKSQNI